MRNFLFAILLISLVIGKTSEAFAQASPTPTPLRVPDSYNPPRGVNITLSPVFLSLSTDPGKPVSSQFKVRNNNNFPEYFNIRLVKIEANNEGTNPTISDIEEGDEFASWVEYSPREFVLNPNQEQTIRLTVSPSEDAALGYYYGFVVGRIEEGEREEEVSGAALSASAALPVLLSVNSPNAKREIQIVDFTTDKLFYEYLPTTFEIKVKNTGNIHVVPFGDVFVDSLFNKEVAVLPANEGRGNVLPGIERTFTTEWKDAFAVNAPKEENGVIVRDGEGNPVYETKFDFSKANLFRFGRYTANLIMVYDNGERDIPIEAQVSFWVIPYKIILGAIAIVVGPALIVYLFMKWRYSRRK